MPRKSSGAAPSKISSSSALTKATDVSTRASSILRSSFAPSYLQLRLFASVIQSFDSEHLRIHDASTGRLRHQHSTQPNESINCLDWGHYGPSYIQSRQSKKRKRPQPSSEDVVVAYGTSNSEISMYSPAQDKVLSRLSGHHERGVKDFKFFVQDNLEAWSIGGEGKLVQWDLSTDSAVRTISLSDPTVHTLAPPAPFPPQLLCASNTPFTIDASSKNNTLIESYDAFKHPVHTVIRSGRDEASELEYFLAVDDDRYINVFDITNNKIVRTLVATAAVNQACLYSPSPATKNLFHQQILAVVTADGAVEIFAQPFLQSAPRNGDIKAKRKGLTKKADAIVKLYGADKQKSEKRILSVAFDGPELVIMSVNAAVEPSFQRLRWQDEGSNGLLFEGLKKVVQIESTADQFTNMNGAKDIGHTAINEAKAVIANGMPQDFGSQPAAIEISSNDEEEDPSEDGGEAEEASEEDDESASETSATEADQQLVKVDIEMEDADEEYPNAQPSFGELLAQKHPQSISITDQLAEQPDLNNPTESRQAILPSGMSLGTVLTQSLRTNDQSLLETCLHVTDANIIQNTILRLDSTLAATLLTKLAERLADRPGRYGHLLTWVQSTMIAHGGAIAGQPNVASKLRTLYQVLNERSKVLPSILLLKGKLDMMNAQHTFRQQAEAQRRNVQAIQSTPAPIYIEGEDERWSSSDDLDEDAQMIDTHPRKSRKPTKDLQGLISDEDSDTDSESDIEQAQGAPLVNGIKHEVNGKIVDDEAEESDERDDEDDEGSDGESQDSDEDEADEEDEDEDDSSMDSFINDGPISEAEDDPVLDEEEPTPTKPSAKKRRHK